LPLIFFIFPMLISETSTRVLSMIKTKHCSGGITEEITCENFDRGLLGSRHCEAGREYHFRSLQSSRDDVVTRGMANLERELGCVKCDRQKADRKSDQAKLRNLQSHLTDYIN
jgi:hypothetical protein